MKPSAIWAKRKSCTNISSDMVQLSVGASILPLFFILLQRYPQYFSDREKKQSIQSHVLENVKKKGDACRASELFACVENTIPTAPFKHWSHANHLAACHSSLQPPLMTSPCQRGVALSSESIGLLFPISYLQITHTQ